MTAEHPPSPPALLRPVGSSRVIIADGEALVRAGLRALLENEGDIEVIAEAASCEDALTLARRLSSDVVLIDVSLPGLGAVETTRQLLEDPGVPVMLLTTSETDERIFAALRAGASGLVLKDAEPGELARAVGVVAGGDALLSPQLTRRLIADFASRPEPGRPDEQLVARLTAREREVLALVALGLSNDEIAEQLIVSPATARTHVSRTMLKLHARDRAQLVVFAYESGIVACPANHGAL
jgi:DNA-binding NarL/FixJ family response regulator